MQFIYLVGHEYTNIFLNHITSFIREFVAYIEYFGPTCKMN